MEPVRTRVRLEQRWRAMLDQIIVMSVACHEHAPAATDELASLSALAESPAGAGDGQHERLVGRLIRAHEELADIEAALDRVKAGGYGFCADCEAAMPPAWLEETPHARTCPDCSLSQLGWAGARAVAGRGGTEGALPGDLAAIAG